MWHALVLVVVVAAGCGLPRDVDGTLDRVRGDAVRVGVAENAPWTVVGADVPGAEVSGAEAALVRDLAVRLDARVEWRRGSESTLMAALTEGELDLVVGGLLDDAPWTEQASLTRPYTTTRVVVATPEDVAAPDDLAGVRVAAPAGSTESAELADKDAAVVRVDDVADVHDMPVAVDDWRVVPLGLRSTRHVLHEEKHVWAVPLGENAWQVEVERFLADLSADEVVRLLDEAQRSSR
ncbi:substrate-binding periplasmic protein [Saccharothrix deserti]|uniref:substrate-binding periplasmic protein n=1 Tax=Saccharothrix deserti TaxID=2593674 RepID=UPI00131DBB20|nr:transporter substrate-binding domain-containing protein [Saccharothrix deserti]